MAQKSYKVGEAIEVVYQALNAKSASTIHMEIYDETHTLVVGGPIVLMELGASGRYYGSFIPDEVGEWTVEIQESDGTGKVVKAFSVGTKNIQDLGAGIDSIQNDTTTLGTNVGVVEGKVDTAHTKIDGVDAKIIALDADIDAIAVQVAGLQSPPMIG